jgi:hypothetical protein
MSLGFGWVTRLWSLCSIPVGLPGRLGKSSVCVCEGSYVSVCLAQLMSTGVNPVMFRRVEHWYHLA